EAGRTELRAWFDTPVPRTNPPRDELAIKLAMARPGGRVDRYGSVVGGGWGRGLPLALAGAGPAVVRRVVLVGGTGQWGGVVWPGECSAGSRGARFGGERPAWWRGA
ncbi:hypothetical protein ABTY15_39630, partial [Kitasatospora sp. NPDC097643]